MPAGRMGRCFGFEGVGWPGDGRGDMIVYCYVVRPGGSIVSRNGPCVPECLDRPEPLGCHGKLVLSCIIPNPRCQIV